MVKSTQYPHASFTLAKTTVNLTQKHKNSFYQHQTHHRSRVSVWRAQRWRRLTSTESDAPSDASRRYRRYETHSLSVCVSADPSSGSESARSPLCRYIVWVEAQWVCALRSLVRFCLLLVFLLLPSPSVDVVLAVRWVCFQQCFGFDTPKTHTLRDSYLRRWASRE